jgi:uncharacterized cofD-like protein
MKNVVTIGGGTGTFVVLSGLKRLPNVSATAIVTTADDGGSTGRLRDAYGYLPVGDARQALVALAEEDTMLRELFAYRFEKGDVKGHNLGNLFLTALTHLLGSEGAAIEEASRILRVSGSVIPASDHPATLVATLTNGSVIRGEHAIDLRDLKRTPIHRLSLLKKVPMSKAAADAIQKADFIILGPGDLYASTAAALLVSGMKPAIMRSKAKLIYFVNLFTKAGQTHGLSADDHVKEIVRYAGRTPDLIFMHRGTFARAVLSHYKKEGECPLTDDLGKLKNLKRMNLASVHTVPPLTGDPVPRSLVRHDSVKIAKALRNIIS